MRLVAISTSGARGSAALFDGDRVAAARDFAEGLAHGRALLPVLADLFREAGWPRSSFDAVAVDIGPGSFTGCRVGLACAKVLAREAKAVLAGVPSLDAIALGVRRALHLLDGRTVSCVLDARRGSVYAGLYESADLFPRRLAGPLLSGAGDWAARTRADLWAGDGLLRHPEAFAGRARAEPDLWIPRAADVAALAAARLARGESDDPYAIQPLYLRASAAEEKASRL